MLEERRCELCRNFNDRKTLDFLSVLPVQTFHRVRLSSLSFPVIVISSMVLGPVGLCTLPSFGSLSLLLFLASAFETGY